MTFAPSAAQTAYYTWIDDGTGNAVLVAVAGAGKTTTLMNGLGLMTRLGEKVFVGAYNSKMADELKSRIAKMDLEGVYASTFHSAGYRQLKFSYKDKALRQDGKKVQRIVDEMVISRADLMAVSPAVAGVVSMAKQRGLGALISAGNPNDNGVWEAMIEHFNLAGDLPENFRMDQLVAFSRAVLKKSNTDLDVIDFDDMVYMPLLFKLRMLKHQWVLIDEAQDTNPTRRALAAAMLAPGGRLVAVGDPHQAIFGFTGADNDSLDLIASQFNAVKLPLTVSYRCPKAVVAVAQNYVSHIEAAETAIEGEFTSMDYAEIVSMANGGDAILCRYNKYLVSTCFALIRAGKSAKIEGRAVGNGLMKLAQRWKSVKTLTALVDKLEDYRGKEIAKALAKKQETRADAVNDLVDTLMVLIERTQAIHQNQGRIEDLWGVIDSIFGDDVSAADMITLCSVHRSKGLEWKTVFVLGLNELMPSPFVTQAWALEQEINLQYVAVTRSQETLVNVTGMKKDDKNGRK